MRSVLLACCLFAPLFAAAQWQELPDAITASFLNSAVAWDGKVYFTGGPKTQNVGVASYNNKVEVVDLDSMTVAPVPGGLSAGRAGIMAAAWDDKIYFAGGFKWQPGVSAIQVFDQVDIYDAKTKTWLPTKHLSVARGFGAAAVVDGRILFAGGFTSFGGVNNPSDVVDLYDPATDLWDTLHLSQARGDLQAAVIGDKVWFCGGARDWYTGKVTARVDVFDLTLLPSGKPWSIDSLSVARENGAVTAAGRYVLCAGGYTDTKGYSERVDIFDTEANNGKGQWSTHTLPAARCGIAAATMNGKAYFTGGGVYNISTGYLQTSTNIVDVFNANDNTWSHFSNHLNLNRTAHSCAAWGNKIAVGGGWRAEQMMTTGSVEILIDNTTPVVERPTAEPAAFDISPNPAFEVLSIVFSNQSTGSIPTELCLSDLSGRVVLRQKMEPGATLQPLSLPIPHLPAGMYFLTAYRDGRAIGVRRVAVAR